MTTSSGTVSRKLPASRRNGNDTATVNSSAPSGGPANELATSSAVSMRPLAALSCGAATMEGRKVWAALS